MTIQLNGEFTDDRFGDPSQSLYFNNGYATIPADVYFNPITGGFTIMAWVKFSSIIDWMSIIDFGLGETDNNIVLAVRNNKMQIDIYSKDNLLPYLLISSVESSKPVVIDQWFHIAVTVSLNSINLYMDGTNYGQYNGSVYFLNY